MMSVRSSVGALGVALLLLGCRPETASCDITAEHMEIVADVMELAADSDVSISRLNEIQRVNGYLARTNAHIARSNLEEACEELARARELIGELKGG